MSNNFQMGHCDDCLAYDIEVSYLKKLLKKAEPIIREQWSELLYQCDPEVTSNDMLRNAICEELEWVQELCLNVEKITDRMRDLNQ